MRILLVLALVITPSLALAEEPSTTVVLPPTYVRPRVPAHVFVARSRTEHRADELRATFTAEIVSSASSAPF